GVDARRLREPTPAVTGSSRAAGDTRRSARDQGRLVLVLAQLLRALSSERATGIASGDVDRSPRISDGASLPDVSGAPGSVDLTELEQPGADDVATEAQQARRLHLVALAELERRAQHQPFDALVQIR